MSPFPISNLQDNFELEIFRWILYVLHILVKRKKLDFYYNFQVFFEFSVIWFEIKSIFKMKTNSIRPWGEIASTIFLDSRLPAVRVPVWNDWQVTDAKIRHMLLPDDFWTFCFKKSETTLPEDIRQSCRIIRLDTNLIYNENWWLNYRI